MQSIKTEINEGKWTTFEETEDIFDLCSILKLFFKELTKPLIPWNLIPELYVASNAASKEIRIQSIIQCLSTLPISHQATLKFLLKHLLKIEAFKDDNKMTFANIGVCFAPSLTMPPDSGVEPDDVNRVTKLAFVMQRLLKQFEDIYSNTVWKFHDFCIIQILREINFKDFLMRKISHFNIFRGSEF